MSRGSVEPKEGDEALMLRVGRGDMRAFEELVRRHEGAVFGAAYRMLGDAGEAEDIAQQAFLKIHRAAGSYQPTAKFTTWMFTILRNLVFSAGRRRGRATFESLDAPVGDGERRDTADDGVAGPGAEVLAAELEREIEGALLALPAQQRLAMVLLRYEELPYEEIARVLETTVPAVKSLIFRARASLRERLEKYLRG